MNQRSEVTAAVNRKELESFVLLVAGEADVVGCDGVQEEPIKAGQVSVHLRSTNTPVSTHLQQVAPVGLCEV